MRYNISFYLDVYVDFARTNRHPADPKGSSRPRLCCSSPGGATAVKLANKPVEPVRGPRRTRGRRCCRGSASPAGAACPGGSRARKPRCAGTGTDGTCKKKKTNHTFKRVLMRVGEQKNTQAVGPAAGPEWMGGSLWVCGVIKYEKIFYINYLLRKYRRTQRGAHAHTLSLNVNLSRVDTTVLFYPIPASHMAAKGRRRGLPPYWCQKHASTDDSVGPHGRWRLSKKITTTASLYLHMERLTTAKKRTRSLRRYLGHPSSRLYTQPKVGLDNGAILIS